MIVAGGNSTSTNGQTPASSGSEIDQLFNLLDDFCSNEQLRHLLRVYRPSERDYGISGNRDHLKQAVRKLYDTGHLPRPRLEAILERAEENGRQHIFLYTPASDAVADRLANFESIESALLDGHTRESAGLPKFQIRPKDVVVADIRREDRAGTKYWSWTYKLYVGAESWRIVGKPELKDDEKIVRYKLHYSREILLVKWHSFGLLEIRIPTASSRHQQLSVRQRLLETLTRAIAEAGDEVEPVAVSIASMASDFDATRKRVKIDPASIETAKLLVPFRLPVSELDAAARSGEIKWIGVNETDYDLDGHTVTVAADDEREDLYQNSTLAMALEKVNDCTRLNALIHVREQPEFLEKLPVEFCPNLRHEFRIATETSPEVIEFIVRRIWEYARGAKALPPSPVDFIVAETPRAALMSTIDFEGVAKTHPYLANAMIRLQHWIREHPTAEYLDPTRLRKALGTGLHAADLAVAVAKLVEEGLLERKYRVRPSGRRSFLPQVFGSLDELLDDEVQDEYGEPVDMGEAIVVPVYGKAGTPDP